MVPQTPMCGLCGRHPYECGHQDKDNLEDSFVFVASDSRSSSNGHAYRRQGDALAQLWSQMSMASRQVNVTGASRIRSTDPRGHYALPEASSWSNSEAFAAPKNTNECGQRQQYASSAGFDRQVPSSNQQNLQRMPSSNYRYPWTLPELDGVAAATAPHGQRAGRLERMGIPSGQITSGNVQHNQNRRTLDENISLRAVRGRTPPETFSSQTGHANNGHHQSGRERHRRASALVNGVAITQNANGSSVPSDARVNQVVERQPADGSFDSEPETENESDRE